VSGRAAFGASGSAEVVRPESAEALAAELTRARAARRTVLPVGHGSRLGALGASREAGVVLSTEGLGRVIEYEPADLTVTVEAGCPLAELDRTLAERGQVLPLQPSRARGTVGGLVATAPESATALAFGGVRDRLTGLRAALADGSLVKGGGRVVKNVAGYGVHRLLAGSRGTLGVVVEASFKVQPRPEARASVLFAFEGTGSGRGTAGGGGMSGGDGSEGGDGGQDDPAAAAQRVIVSGLEPLFVDLLWHGDATRMVVGFEGTRERVEAHVEQVVEIVGPWKPEGRRVLSPEEDDRLRRALDDWTAPDARLPGESSAPAVSVVVRLSDRPARIVRTTRLAMTAGASADGDAQVTADVRRGTGSAFVRIAADRAGAALAAVRAVLESARKTASAVVLAAPPEIVNGIDVWGARPPDFFLMKRIKEALDPESLFASGGFVGGL